MSITSSTSSTPHGRYLNHNPGQVASIFLILIGCFDLFRGVAHTYLMHWANDTFANLDLSHNGDDQLMLMGAFGISNWLTGMLYILIGVKAKSIATATLVIILLAYAIGYVGIKFAGVSPDSNFYGRFIMMGYFAVCAVGIGWQLVVNRRQP
jgi:hypothetical protein